MLEHINKISLAIYLIIFVIFISVLFYQFLYNKIIIGSINNDMERLNIPNNKKKHSLFYYDFTNTDIDNQKKANKNINTIFIIFAIIFCLFYSSDMYDNIKINMSKVWEKVGSKILIWIAVITVPVVIIIFKSLYLEKSNIDANNNKEIKIDDMLKSNKHDGIRNGIFLITLVMFAYYIFRSVIKNGIIKVSINNFNNFILYEKIFILLFVTLFYCSIIVAVNKKMSITQNIIDNKVEKRDLNDRIREISTSIWNTDYKDYFDNITNVDNNHLINIIFGVLSIILVLYFYLNHIKNSKFDLINSLVINKGGVLKRIVGIFDYKILVLIALLLLIGIIPEVKLLERLKKVEEEKG